MSVSAARAIDAIHANSFKQGAHVSGESRRVKARILLGGLGIFAGIVHLALAGPHFEEAMWLGTAFLVDGLGLGATGIWRLLSHTRRAGSVAGLIATLTVIAFLVSRTLGLPGMKRETWDALGLVTTLVELAIVVSWLFDGRPEREASVGRSLTSNGRRDV